MDNNLGSINNNNQVEKVEENTKQLQQENDSKEINNKLNPSDDSSKNQNNSESFTNKNDCSGQKDNKKENQYNEDIDGNKISENLGSKQDDEIKNNEIIEDEKEEIKIDEKKEEEKVKDENNIKEVKEVVKQEINENSEDKYKKDEKKEKELNHEEKNTNEEIKTQENKDMKKEDKIIENNKEEEIKINIENSEEKEDKEKEKNKNNLKKDKEKEKNEAMDKKKSNIEKGQKEEDGQISDKKEKEKEEINKAIEEVKEEKEEKSQKDNNKAGQENILSEDKSKDKILDNNNIDKKEREKEKNLINDESKIKTEEENEKENKPEKSQNEQEDENEVEILGHIYLDNSEGWENFEQMEKSKEVSELAKRLEEQETKAERFNETLNRLEMLKRKHKLKLEKKELCSYEKSLNDLLLNIENSWSSEDKNNFATNYELKYINNMNDLFSKINDCESTRDKVIVLIFKFICDYLYSRRKVLNEIPWVELNNIKRILSKNNFEGICILSNNQLLINCYRELLNKYKIENDDENIIEYNDNLFYKYLIEFLFRDGFFELYIDNVITREDEIFLSFDNYIYDNTSIFVNDLLSIILYPLEALNFCQKDYLLKNTFHKKYINSFLKKINVILNSSALKEEFKKNFYGEIINKYKFIMKNFFNKVFDEFKEKNSQICENFINFFTKTGEFYLHQQKLETRIYGLTLITQLIDTLQNMNVNPNEKNGKIFSYVKESVIKYMSKINIYNLIFGENIHEALVHRSYNILSFLYKNKAFKQEQIKHLWNLSQDKYQTISENIIELFGRLLPEFSTNDSNAILKIVSEMNLSEVNEVTLKLLENFFNSNEKNEKLYNILYKLSDELSLNEGLSKNIIIKSRSILVKLLFNQNYTKNLITIIKKCIFNIGKNYLVNTSLSLLKLILEEFDKKEGAPDIKKIFTEINPNIHNMELLIKYLEKKGDLFSVLFANMLDNSKLIQFLLEETKTLKQIINNKESYDIELPLKLDEMYKKFIDPENQYYFNYGLNPNAPEQIINNINSIRQVSSNQLDKTQSTEKSLNEGLIENEEDLEGNNQNFYNVCCRQDKKPIVIKIPDHTLI